MEASCSHYLSLDSFVLEFVVIATEAATDAL